MTSGLKTTSAARVEVTAIVSGRRVHVFAATTSPWPTARRDLADILERAAKQPQIFTRVKLPEAIKLKQKTSPHVQLEMLCTLGACANELYFGAKCLVRVPRSHYRGLLFFVELV